MGCHVSLWWLMPLLRLDYLYKVFQNFMLVCSEWTLLEHRFCVIGMISCFLRMKQRTEWWRLKNSLTGFSKKHVLRSVYGLFWWKFKQSWFDIILNYSVYFHQKTSFMLFLNKFDIFEKKVQKVSVLSWILNSKSQVYILILLIL